MSEQDPRPESRDVRIEAEHDAPVPGLKRDIIDAIRGRQRDYTTGNLRRNILILAIPMVLEMFMQSVFAVADAWFVGRLDSAEALAAVGLTESMLSVVFAIGLGLAMGTTATVARRIGAKDPEAAAVASVQAIGLGLFLSIILGTLGVILSKDLLLLMDASPEVIATGHGYAQHILGGSGTIVLLFLINAVFRGAGDPALAMRALWIANIINIVLDPIFIFGLGPIPAMGVTGAAVATNIGRGIGVLYQLSVLWRGVGHIKVRGPQIQLHFTAMIRLVRISSVGMFQFLVGTTSYLGMIRVLAALDDDAALAGYTIAIRVLIFALLPGWGVANAAATLVGQNLGAGQPNRAEHAVWATARYNLVFLVTVSIAMLVFPHAIVGLFIDDAEVVAYGAQALRVISFGYAFFAYGMVMMMAFNGAGDTWTPTYINLLFHWVLKIPLAIGLAAYTGLGALGVFLAIPIAESLGAVVYILLFRRGTWKHREV